MCQYYHWQCHQCTGTNDVVVRCKVNVQQQRKDPCARIRTLPLPSDAPKLECQQCVHYHPPARPHERTPRHQGLDTSFRRLSLQVPCGLVMPSNQTAANPFDSPYPSEYDVFWLEPSRRLPDAEIKLSEYREQRAKVFHTAHEEEKMKLASGAEQHQKPNRNAAWEESWSALQEALGGV